MKKLTVVKSNRVVEASYSLTLNEQRLILACIAQIKRGETIKNDTEFEVSAADFASLFGITTNRAYRDLREAGKALFERYVVIKPTDIKNDELHSRWISSVHYQAGQGSIKLYFAQAIIPYISKLQSEFTIYNIEAISKMTHAYSVRIYELLVQWKGVGQRKIDIDDLRRMLCLEDKYKAIKDFKAKVLHPALKEINEYTDLNVEYEQYKDGRTIKGFDFTFSIKEELKPIKITKSYIEQHARAGESYQQAEDRLRKLLET